MNKSEARKILGVEASADKEAIKKAYRSLAMKHHPDREGGDEVKFKQLQEALDVLEKPDQKSNWNSNIPDSMRDFMRQFSTSHATLEVTIEEGFKGTQKTINVQGIGQIVVDIPAGTCDEDKLKSIEMPNGYLDILAKITSKDKVDWGRQSLNKKGDITKEFSIPVIKMIIGGWEDVTTLDGSTVSVRIPAGLGTNKLLKVKEKGYWKNKDRCSERGDLYLRAIPLVQKIDEMNRADIEAFISAANLKEEK